MSKTKIPPPYQKGDWIVVKEGFKNRTRVCRATFNSHPYVRHASPAEIEEAEHEEAEKQRINAEYQVFRSTPEYVIASRLLSMEERELIRTLGPELLARIATALEQKEKER